MVDASYVQLSDGRQVGYQEYGDRDGRPVFFFHGWIALRCLLKLTVSGLAS